MLEYSTRVSRPQLADLQLMVTMTNQEFNLTVKQTLHAGNPSLVLHSHPQSSAPRVSIDLASLFAHSKTPLFGLPPQNPWRSFRMDIVAHKVPYSIFYDEGANLLVSPNEL